MEVSNDEVRQLIEAGVASPHMQSILSELLTLRQAQAEAAEVERMRDRLFDVCQEMTESVSYILGTEPMWRVSPRGKSDFYGDSLHSAMSVAHAAVCEKDGDK